MNAEIFTAEKSGILKVKVVGRATFAVAPALRDFVKSVDEKENIKAVEVNLAECTGMDSTFMGILAMLALKARKKKFPVKVINPGINKKLLDGLGLSKMFEYIDIDEPNSESWRKTNIEMESRQQNAKTVLDAHQVLMEADEGNVEKFKTVVDMVKKDIEK